jgi:amino acid transporter
VPKPSSTTAHLSDTQDLHKPQPTLSPVHAIALIVGIVVGAGIFKSPSVVAELIAAPEWMFGAWLAGGLVSVIGALCYAELASAYPHAGGDYHFLGRAYGRSLSFLFAWARFAVTTTGSIALLAFIFGDYLQLLLPLPELSARLGAAVYAAAIVLLLTRVNLHGAQTGAHIQSWFTLLEVGGLLLIVGAAWLLPAAEPTAPLAVSHSAPGLQAFGLAMVFVLLSFGGWNEAATISAELRDGPRNMCRVLLISLAIITALYLLVIWAYWHGLGMTGMARSDAVAASLLEKALGRTGASVMALLVIASTLTSINATIIVGARSSYAAGRDWSALRYLGQWQGLRGTPANALRVQCLMTLVLIAAGTWAGDGFRAMVEFTAPVFWFFFLLSGISLFVLRWREPDVRRPFRVPLYPLIPLLFCLMSAAMLWASLAHVGQQSLAGINASWVGVIVLAAGVILLWWVRKSECGKIDQPERSA